MGCFNVSCGISGISMFEDDAVLIPLIKTDMFKYHTFTGTSIVSNEGIKDSFQPLTLPIFGKLDSYGRLENIKKDYNTERIEEYYKLPIFDFVDRICSNWKGEKNKDKNDPIPSDISGMYIHRDIFNKLSKGLPDEYGRSHKGFGHNADVLEYILNIMGFNYVSLRPKSDNPEENRFNRLFKNDNFPEIDVYSDKTWVKVESDGKQLKGSSYHPNEFIETIENYTKKKFSNTIKKFINSTPYYSIMFDVSKKELEDQEKENKIVQSTGLSLNDNTFLKYSRLKQYGMLFKFSPGYHDIENIEYFSTLYPDLDKIKDLLISMKNVEESMFSCNKLYFPTFNGYQHGNKYAEKILHEETLKVINDKIKKNQEENGEE
jgi:hypothetical protein